MSLWVERPTILVDLGRLYRGELPALPAEAVTAAKSLLDEVLAPVPKKARLLAYLLAIRTGDRFGREFKASAQMIHADARDIALANLSYDLVVGMHGCSTLVLPTADGPVLARNMDWPPEGPVARATYNIRFITGDRWEFSAAGFPGATGIVSGLSSRGFGIVLNAVTTPDPISKSGYPVLLHIRRVFEDAAGFSDALAMLSKQRLTTPALFTLVGTKNDERVVVERSQRRHALRWGRVGEPLLTTNNYLVLNVDQPKASPAHAWDVSETTCERYLRLSELASGWESPSSPKDEELLFWLTDALVRQDITAQHVIIRPAQNSIKVFTPTALMREGFG
jgi:hypothetical protein